MQQVKRLRLLSFNQNQSPLLNKQKQLTSRSLNSTTNSSYSNILSQAAIAATTSIENCLSNNKKTLTSKFIEFEDEFNSNSCSLDSGFSQQHQEEEEQEQEDEQYHEDDEDISFSINKNTINKLLDISNCSIQSNSSINSPFQARRCLFKTNNSTSIKSPLATISTTTPFTSSSLSTINNNNAKKSQLQITPISISRHNSIITNEPHHESDNIENEYILSSLFQNETKNQLVTKQQNNDLVVIDEYDSTKRLIGDRSSYHILPCKTNIKHNDLNVITPNTLTKVLNGDYDSQIDKLIIIDSRYPYEYAGGHIKSAQNIYTKENIIEMFLNNSNNKEGLINNNNNNKRVLVIFHCEFSSERGPRLMREIRERDRALNKQAYPRLHYPEMYLLEGGYKSFFESFETKCEPKCYVQMLDDNHRQDLKFFRKKSKSLDLENKKRSLKTKLSF